MNQQDGGQNKATQYFVLSEKKYENKNENFKISLHTLKIINF